MSINILLGHSKASHVKYSTLLRVINTHILANKDGCYSNTAVALMTSYSE